ncbi:MAG: class B sortase [Raoultibacter sp.]
MTSIQSQHSKPESPKASSKRTRTIIALIVAIVVLLGCAVAGIGSLFYVDAQTKLAAPTPTPQAPPAPAEEPVLIDNPIDFQTLQSSNPDIYAWISVPNTNVNYPVCSSTVDDSFYLDHDADKNYSLPGIPYSEVANGRALSDPVTLIYGHNGYGDTMFATLHNFEDPTFFANNEKFYLYTPGHVYTYRVVSAFMYDNRHILNSFDFSNEATVQSFFNMLAAPDSLLVNARAEVALSPTDKVVCLSTCMDNPAQHDNRYIVSGVLLSDQRTK